MNKYAFRPLHNNVYWSFGVLSRHCFMPFSFLFCSSFFLIGSLCIDCYFSCWPVLLRLKIQWKKSLHFLIKSSMYCFHQVILLSVFGYCLFCYLVIFVKDWRTTKRCFGWWVLTGWYVSRKKSLILFRGNIWNYVTSVLYTFTPLI